MQQLSRVETGAEGVALVLVEVEVVGGTSGLHTEVTVATFLTLVEGRALRINMDKARVNLSV